MRLPPPDGWRARLVHDAVALAALPLRRRYGPPVPPALLSEPEPFSVTTPRGAFATYAWGGDGAAGTGSAGSPRPPVVLVHGLNANARYWVGVASLLGETRRVLAYDQRRHGRTGALSGGLALPETREDLRALLDTQALGQVDLVGHSWGGKVCLDFAAAYPERVRRLVLADPVPPTGLHRALRGAGAASGAIFSPERGPFPDRAALEAAAARISWLRHAAPWARRAFLANFRPAGDDAAPAAARPWRHVLDDVSFHALYTEVIAAPSPLPLDAVRLPVLLLRATFSAMPFPGEVAWLAARLPDLTVAHVPGEHSLHLVNPGGLAAAIRPFLAA